jgi:hypothetical protein
MTTIQISISLEDNKVEVGNIELTPVKKTFDHYRISHSKGKNMKLTDMHPVHLFNAMLKDLNDGNFKAQDVIGDPYWQEVFTLLANAEIE